MKIKFVLTIILIGFLQNIFTYPITPRPLRKLISESEIIVYANVINIETIESDNHWNDTKAILVIKEVLQGNIKNDTIEVYFTPFMICPTPAHYEKGTNVLAFLDKEKEKFITHALSYGSKTLETEGYEIYKERIIEMQKISKIKNEEDKTSKTIDWLISCATNKYTRWEGVYELSPQSDFMSFYDQDKETFVQKYTLNKNQKLQLRRAFFNIDDLTYADIGLIDLVVRENDKELVEFLIRKLKETAIEKLWYKNFLMARIAEFSDRDDLRKIVQEMEEIDFMDKKRDEKANQLAKKFIEKI
ncbi:MAG: hypothetical protein ACK5MD_06750 [Flavobacteriales bacterium]